MDMDNINEIFANLSAEDMSALQNAAQSIFGASGNDGEKKEQPADSGKSANEAGPSDIPDLSTMIDPAMLMRLTQMMGSFQKKDSRSDLISALKPHLSAPKQKRADDAMQLMRLLDFFPMLTQQEKPKE